MNKHEMDFWHELAALMKGTWIPTRHEDREINPGVPDVSFVMIGDGYETGWLELKATPWSGRGNIKFNLEPSQHHWLRDHHTRIPVFLLVSAGDSVWLVDARHHHMFAHVLSEKQLCEMAVERFDRSLPSTFKMKLYAYLRELTHRSR